MRYLKRLALTIVALLLLGFIKGYFDRSGAVYADFYRNLLANLQLLLFLCVIVVSAVQFIIQKRSGRPVNGWKVLAIFLLLLGLLEVWMQYLLVHSRSIPSALLDACREYYGNYGRNQLEFDNRCARYNGQLSYTLRPNSHFAFNNYEFKTEYTTNSLGVRDDDSSMVRPEVICLGDSHTMGWGVNQQESFSEVLAATTKMRVLNAGVASYGTAREVLSLQKMDLSQLKYLCIQYCGNDVTENTAFVENNYHLTVMPEQKFDSLCATLRWRQKYYPFRHILTIARFAMQQWKTGRTTDELNPAGQTAEFTRQAELFSNIISHAALPPGVKIIVFDITGDAPMEQRFVNALKQLQQRKMEVIDIASFMKKDFFFPLDRHMNASGHQKVAELLNKAMQNQ
ncbi:MAG TPA: hypothetical protein VEB42_07325 [Chitinophagaceae bacterium]|nr:hypothetical protein [Chitinophagaceae bacterium]